MYVKERFILNKELKNLLKKTPKFGYNGFGEFVFYRTYSRIKKDGSQESWCDVVIRVVEGTMSIRKDWYLKTGVYWDEEYWQTYSIGFALSLFNMEWMPPGRGLWAMGSDFVYERGAMALYNCAYTNITDDFSDDLAWLMDALMHGVGVGFGPKRNDKMELFKPRGQYDFLISDSREGWVESVRQLLYSYQKPNCQRPLFHYDGIRPAGAPIKGYGGICSGPESLKKLHIQIVEACENFKDSVRFKTDIANMIGCCVVAGNVRRSAELACASVNDVIFMDLKDYEKYPERSAYGYMSNNSAILKSDKDFDMLGEIAKRVIVRGEPGALNRKNFPLGRVGKKTKVRKDKAVGLNPCGEIPLEHREVCNLAETCPTVCDNIELWFDACEYATFYCSTVSLLPTHQLSTNRIVARNRRIGVSIIDFVGWKERESVHKVTEYMRQGYKIIRKTNKELNNEAGVPEAIRVTTIKPGGTVPKLPGKRPGLSHSNFDYMIRRVRVQSKSQLTKILKEAGVPGEPDVNEPDQTMVFEFPVYQPGRTASEVSLWEQSANLVLLQREWSDNAVSNTLNFKPKWAKIDIIKNDFQSKLAFYVDLQIQSIGLAKDLINEKRDIYETDSFRFIFKWENSISYLSEGFMEKKLISIDVYQFDPHHEENDIEAVLSAIMPSIKSVSFLPHSGKGVYPQMPEEGIDKQEYDQRVSMIDPINWSEFKGSDGLDEKYCDGDKCERLS